MEGTIHILREHIFWNFSDPPATMSAYIDSLSTVSQQTYCPLQITMLLQNNFGPIVRQHNFLLFLTHPLTMSAYSTERQLNWPFYKLTNPANHPPSPFADIIYGWSLL